jgi:hypothetical protein
MKGRDLMGNVRTDIVEFAETYLNQEIPEWYKRLLKAMVSRGRVSITGYRYGKLISSEIVEKYLKELQLRGD